MNQDVILGKKLKALRSEKGYKQSEVAERVGVTKYTMSRMENGKHHTAESIVKSVCAVYDVDYKELMIAVINESE